MKIGLEIGITLLIGKQILRIINTQITANGNVAL